MSQILDALRRAEAQRSRGRVPGLHEPVASLPRSSTRAPTPRSLRTLLIGFALLLALGTLGAVFLLPRADDPGPTPVLRGSHPTGDVARAPADVASTAAPAVIIRPDQAAAEKSKPRVGLPRKAQLAESRDATREMSPRSVVQPARSAEAAIDGSGESPPVTAAPPIALSSLPTRQQLPPDIQRLLPVLTVSGSIYSSDPAQRILVINGELWHEGDHVRPGLVLEQIRRRDAVLRFNGVRFTIGP